MNSTGTQKSIDPQATCRSAFGRNPSCIRCQGLLVKEYLLDMKQDDSIWGAGWRCVNCGAIADSIIQANRLRHCHQMRDRDSKLKRGKESRKLLVA